MTTTKQTPRVLVTVQGGVANIATDGEVSVELIDFDNTPDAKVSEEFADLAPWQGIIKEEKQQH